VVFIVYLDAVSGILHSKTNKKELAMSDKAILVTGDCTIDHHVYEGRPGESGTTIVPHRGGTALLHKLLTETSRQLKGDGFSVFSGANERLKKCLPHTFSLWLPLLAKDGSSTRTWAFSRSLGSAPVKTSGQMSAKMAINSPPCQVLLINDAGLYFRHGANRRLWPKSILDSTPEEIDRVVLSTVAPLAHGDLWRELSTRCRKNLVTIVSLRDVVKEEAGVSVGISWERTLEELSSELLRNGVVSELLNCGDLVVRIGKTGALWVSNRNEGDRAFTAVLDPARLENDSGAEGDEASLCFAAAVATRLVCQEKDAILMGIYSGLSAIRDLCDLGYAQTSHKQPSFPYKEVATSLCSAPSGFTMVAVPAYREEGGSHWSIMGGDLSMNLGIARRVALFGLRALGFIPYSRFGKMTVVDRNEIESLCGLKQLMGSYKNQEKPERPLSIAVFGAPGSGKSFGVKQIGKEILGADCVILEFNLSQFASPEELVGALHQVRDKVLEGTIPMVFWDEFDSKEYTWLQYLLAPMQDGKFREGQLTHLIGKCVFIFAGGTSHTMQNFTPGNSADAVAKFKMVKGPDFISRLNGFLNVLGPDPRQRFDEESQKWVSDDVTPDNCYPIRRALLIRSVMKLAPDEHLQMDQGILTALLEISCYNHGARSLETVINLARHRAPTVVRSNLPPEEQLSLHVDYEEFMALLKRDLPFRMNAEGLASAIHENFRALSKKERTKIEYDVDFEALPPDIKASNVAAAARIPMVLSLAGLKVQPATSVPVKTDPKMDKIIEDNIELLAEAEHDGWMDEKLKNGWSYGPIRNNDLKLHPSIIPYGNLSKEDKEKDRDSVRRYPGVAANVGYEVVKGMRDPIKAKQKEKVE
jgi:hypothetical protein